MTQDRLHPLPTYAAVADLPDDELRNLLVTGEPTEKVWAAWTLGLRAHVDRDRMRHAASSSPEPGVRRHVIVVLVGLGELGAVSVLAIADPDASVRATACRFLVRLAGARPELWRRAADRLDDEAADVRAAIIEEVGGDVPRQVEPLFLARVDDPALDVRRAVADLVERLARAGRFPDSLVQSRLVGEPDPDLRARWQRLWLGTRGVQGFFSPAFDDASGPLVEEALERLAASGAPVTWRDVAAAARWAAASPGKALVGLFSRRLDEVPLPVLLDYLGAPGRADECCSFPFLEHLIARLQAPDVAELTTHQRETIAAFGWRARQLVAQFSSTPWLHEDEEESSWPEQDDSWEQDQREWQAAVKEFAALCERVAGLR